MEAETVARSTLLRLNLHLLDGGRFPPAIDAQHRRPPAAAAWGRPGRMTCGSASCAEAFPDRLARDGAALARFHREVRTARQITHKNVVRVHDLGEVDGAPFLTMEYVDGEDLSSLLKRIGRLPEDKAVELARQLCAGLAAAHERGVLHRDLKPANVMIDGEGRARISDFGVAGLVEELDGAEVAGTPAYMAPEQLAGGKVSFASDLYSLGLVLYEMFTGKKAHPEGSAVDLAAHHRSGTAPPTLVEHVPGLDPLVETVVRKCLDSDPGRRPASALDVAAALPGGDPLAAALAAGETPSPEMVARAGGSRAVPRWVAAGLTGTAVVCVLGSVVLAGRTQAPSLDPPLEPAVLAHRAREIAALSGFVPSDEAWGFAPSRYHLEETLTGRRTSEEWRELAGRRPPLYDFWFRGSDGELAPTRRWAWAVEEDDPPLLTPGTATLWLDGQGRLRSLLVVPEEGAEAAGVVPDGADWAPYFEAAGLDPADFEAVAPSRAPPLWVEERGAWTGTYPGQAEPVVDVVAARRGGRVVWWELGERAPERSGAEEATDASGAEGSGAGPVTRLIALSTFAALWLAGGLLARRHLATGRGDRRGAWRVAVAVTAMLMTAWVLIGRHSASPTELSLLFAAIAEATLFGVTFWLFYLAIEPIARRLWPRQLTSWTRLVSGRWDDPLVARDLVAGFACFGVWSVAVQLWRVWSLEHGGGTIDWFFPHGLVPFYGARVALGNAFSMMQMLLPFCFFLILILVRLVVRHELASVVVTALLLGLLSGPANGWDAPAMLMVLLTVAVIWRFGLLGMLGFAIMGVDTLVVPVSADPAVWWSGASAVGWMVPVVLALVGYRLMRRGGEGGAASPGPSGAARARS
ncbi:MAG: serine/threonine-protein kinase [Thermoanaerobaculia bacterium]